MAQDHGTPAADEVDVFVAVNVPDAASFGMVVNDGFNADVAEGANGGVDAAGNALLGFGEGVMGIHVFHCKSFRISVRSASGLRLSRGR